MWTLGRQEEALVAYDKALALNPRLELAWLGKGNVLMTLGLPAEALTACDTALTLNPSLEEGWFQKGNVLMALGRPMEALAALDQVLVLNLGTKRHGPTKEIYYPIWAVRRRPLPPVSRL